MRRKTAKNRGKNITLPYILVQNCQEINFSILLNQRHYYRGSERTFEKKIKLFYCFPQKKYSINYKFIVFHLKNIESIHNSCFPVLKYSYLYSIFVFPNGKKIEILVFQNKKNQSFVCHFCATLFLFSLIKKFKLFDEVLFSREKKYSLIVVETTERDQGAFIITMGCHQKVIRYWSRTFDPISKRVWRNLHWKEFAMYDNV